MKIQQTNHNNQQIQRERLKNPTNPKKKISFTTPILQKKITNLMSKSFMRSIKSYPTKKTRQQRLLTSKRKRKKEKLTMTFLKFHLMINESSLFLDRQNRFSQFPFLGIFDVLNVWRRKIVLISERWGTVFGVEAERFSMEMRYVNYLWRDKVS